MATIKLTAETLGETREFKISHAQRLLDYQAKHKANDWKIDDNRYIVEHGIIKPVGRTKEPQKQG